jgi:hypothetical protein
MGNEKRATAKGKRSLLETVTCAHCGSEQQVGRDSERWACHDCKTAHEVQPAQ